MKKVLILFLSIFSFISFNAFVSASTIDLTVVPDTYGEYYDYLDSLNLISKWPSQKSELNNGYYMGLPTFNASSGYDVFDFGNISLCNNDQSLTISGLITTRNYEKFVKNPFVNVQAYISDDLVSCSFNVIDSTTIRYSCSGKGGGNLKFIVNYKVNYPYSFGSTFDVNTTAISKTADVFCGASNNDIIQNNSQNTQDIINNQNQNQQQTNDRLDDIINSDISDSDKELPSDDDYNNYQNAENDLMDKVNQADTSIIDIAIDTNSSNFVWTNLTNFLKSNGLVFSTFIAILSIGIIKLALGR